MSGTVRENQRKRRAKERTRKKDSKEGRKKERNVIKASVTLPL